MTAEDDREPAPVFTGLCIGGPMAGAWKDYGQPYFKCVEQQGYAVPLDSVDEVEATVKVHHYKHIIGFRHRVAGQWTEDVLNFWIPANENWTPLDCVKMMAEDYGNYHDLRNS